MSENASSIGTCTDNENWICYTYRHTKIKLKLAYLMEDLNPNQGKYLIRQFS